jgi:protein AroM
MRLAVITIGQAPRTDLTPEIAALLPAGTDLIEHGALDLLDADAISALTPRPGESSLTSRLRDGGSATFGHDQAMPRVEQAIARAEADGADASLIGCTGTFPPLAHTRPLFIAERLAHAGVRGLLTGAGGRLGVVRPLADQVEEAYDHWERSIGIRPAAVTSVNPYTESPDAVARAAASIADFCDLIVLDCMGFDETMRLGCLAVCGATPVVTVRSVAARLLASLL